MRERGLPSVSPGPCTSLQSRGGPTTHASWDVSPGRGRPRGAAKPNGLGWLRSSVWGATNAGCQGSQEWRWAGGGRFLSRLGPGRAGGGEQEFASARGGWLRAASRRLWECPVFLHVQPLPPGSPLGVQHPLPGSLRASVAASQAGDPGLASRRLSNGGAGGVDPLSPGVCWFTSLSAQQLWCHFTESVAGRLVNSQKWSWSMGMWPWALQAGRGGLRVPGWVGEPAGHHPCGLRCGPICIILNLIGLKATSLNHS